MKSWIFKHIVELMKKKGYDLIRYDGSHIIFGNMVNETIISFDILEFDMKRMKDIFFYKEG